jgi:hypothetical protein
VKAQARSNTKQNGEGGTGSSPRPTPLCRHRLLDEIVGGQQVGANVRGVNVRQLNLQVAVPAAKKQRNNKKQ